jgi:hypothetical protein
MNKEKVTISLLHDPICSGLVVGGIIATTLS